MFKKRFLSVCRGRLDYGQYKKGRKRKKKEKSDAPTNVRGHSIVTLGKAVSSQCSAQFRSRFPCQVFWRLIPFRACSDHAYGLNIYISDSQRELSWSISLSGHLQQPYQHESVAIVALWSKHFQFSHFNGRNHIFRPPMEGERGQIVKKSFHTHDCFLI